MHTVTRPLAYVKSWLSLYFCCHFNYLRLS